jgi:hypothetical protein
MCGEGGEFIGIGFSVVIQGELAHEKEWDLWFRSKWSGPEMKSPVYRWQ